VAQLYNIEIDPAHPNLNKENDNYRFVSVKVEIVDVAVDRETRPDEIFPSLVAFLLLPLLLLLPALGLAALTFPFRRFPFRLSLRRRLRLRLRPRRRRRRLLLPLRRRSGFAFPLGRRRRPSWLSSRFAFRRLSPFSRTFFLSG